LLSVIVEYVGERQYRFVASLDRRFHEVYLNLFYKLTYVNASTTEHANICLRE
jgi:hypothetical protein